MLNEKVQKESKADGLHEVGLAYTLTMHSRAVFKTLQTAKKLHRHLQNYTEDFVAMFANAFQKFALAV